MLELVRGVLLGLRELATPVLKRPAALGSLLPLPLVSDLESREAKVLFSFPWDQAPERKLLPRTESCCGGRGREGEPTGSGRPRRPKRRRTASGESRVDGDDASVLVRNLGAHDGPSDVDQSPPERAHGAAWGHSAPRRSSTAKHSHARLRAHSHNYSATHKSRTDNLTSRAPACLHHSLSTTIISQQRSVPEPSDQGSRTPLLDTLDFTQLRHQRRGPGLERRLWDRPPAGRRTTLHTPATIFS